MTEVKRLFNRRMIALAIMVVSIAFNATLLASLYVAYKEQRLYLSRPKADGERLALEYYRERCPDDDISALIETRSHLRVSVLKDGQIQKVLLVVNGQVYEETGSGKGTGGTGAQQGGQVQRSGR